MSENWKPSFLSLIPSLLPRTKRTEVGADSPTLPSTLTVAALESSGQPSSQHQAQNGPACLSASAVITALGAICLERVSLETHSRPT